MLPEQSGACELSVWWWEAGSGSPRVGCSLLLPCIGHPWLGGWFWSLVGSRLLMLVSWFSAIHFGGRLEVVLLGYRSVQGMQMESIFCAYLQG